MDEFMQAAIDEAKVVAYGLHELAALQESASRCCLPEDTDGLAERLLQVLDALGEARAPPPPTRATVFEAQVTAPGPIGQWCGWSSRGRARSATPTSGGLEAAMPRGQWHRS